jgi:hypothetical protein
MLNTVMYNIPSTLDTRDILVVGYITRCLVVVSVIKLIYLFQIMLLATAEAECWTFCILNHYGL